MRVRVFVRRGLAAGLVLALSATSALAQGGSGSQAPRPVRFGQGAQDLGQYLMVTADVSAGRDVLTGLDLSSTGTAPTSRRSGFATGLVSADYSLNKGWLGARASAAAVSRYFAAQQDPFDVASYGGAGVSLDIPVSTRLSVTGQADLSMQPVSTATLFPGLFSASGSSTLPTEFDLGALFGRQYVTAADTALTYALTRRSSLGVGYRWYTIRGTLSGPRQESQRAHVRYQHALTRFVSYHLGYGRERAGQVDGGPGSTARQHIFDVGVDLGAAGQLALTRRLTLGLSTGTVLLSDQASRRLELVGNATLGYQFARTWTTSIGYYRGVGFVQTFARPTFSDSLAADVVLQIGRRVSVQARTGVVSGRIGLTDPSNDYLAYQSAINGSLQLYRSLALTAGYSYFRYRFDASTLLPIAFGTDVRRHAIQGGTTITLPLIGGRSRRTNAAR